MDAFDLADQFQQFFVREWPTVEDQEPTELEAYFKDWAIDGIDLIGATGGSYTMALQTFLIIVARFAQHPEWFEPVRHIITIPIDLPPGARRLPGLLDEGEWKRQVRIYKRRFPRSPVM